MEPIPEDEAIQVRIVIGRQTQRWVHDIWSPAAAYARLVTEGAMRPVSAVTGMYQIKPLLRLAKDWWEIDNAIAAVDGLACGDMALYSGFDPVVFEAFTPGRSQLPAAQWLLYDDEFAGLSIGPQQFADHCGGDIYKACAAFHEGSNYIYEHPDWLHAHWY